MREQAELETHITTQIQHLLSGGSGQRSCEEDDQPFSSVCLDNEYYLFVPADESKTQCHELQCKEPTRIFRTPPVSCFVLPLPIYSRTKKSTLTKRSLVSERHGLDFYMLASLCLGPAGI